MTHPYQGSLKGHLLMAMPTLVDPNFSYTVTCMCEHTENGALGIIVNRVHFALTAKDIFEELKIDYIPRMGALPVHIGGPVHIDEVFILHGPPFNWKGCLVITPFLAMSNTRDILEAIALGKGPESVIIALGCAGWGPNQLETEMISNAWLTCPAIKELIFDIDNESKWEKTIRQLGIEPGLLSHTAGHA